MKNKWNWGWGILFSIIIFMGIIIAIVASMMNREVDLVTDKYYEKESKYQQQIDKEKRTSLLNQDLNVEYTGSVLLVFFPKDSLVTGDLYFYRPSNFHKDFKLPITVDVNFRQSLDVSKLDRGLWKLQINWTVNKIDYYTEKTLMLN